MSEQQDERVVVVTPSGMGTAPGPGSSGQQGGGGESEEPREVSPVELVEELERITLPFGNETPTDAELRIAQAQLVGWLEGLFHGIQTALVAQQMAARMQLEGMRHQLPPGVSGGPGGQVPGYVVEGQGGPGDPRDRSGDDPSRQTGQYL
jgi:hypothetical protein